MKPLFDFQFMIAIIPDVLQVVPVTLNITAVSMVLALFVGLTTALVRIYRVPLAKQLAALYISFTRGTPLLVQIYLAYYGIPKVLEYLQLNYGWNLNVNGIPAIVFIYFAFTLNVGAYLSETIRASIEAIDKGQMEAALSIGMTRLQGMRRIILPQAVAIALPSFGNTFISLIKDTSLAFMISVVEMMGQAKILGARGLQFFEVYIVVALIYWGICILVERVVAVLETRAKRFEGAKTA
ncbi:L-cystine transport system permease protein [Hydrogenispora ethanolica]|uniref:L-cystine transport system permease protein n=1 Tax=Hydrogenispora ethanolica TaxID=1082276 RepID=A0A4R1RU39_HYDET|nr:amino acid ABC transporter permease [Hydrogenispora ethanolica]TCL69904.1 L-cystine transport system permease protein [Hydrogenispora ethanolica]